MWRATGIRHQQTKRSRSLSKHFSGKSASFCSGLHLLEEGLSDDAAIVLSKQLQTRRCISQCSSPRVPDVDRAFSSVLHSLSSLSAAPSCSAGQGSQADCDSGGRHRSGVSASDIHVADAAFAVTAALHRSSLSPARSSSADWSFCSADSRQSVLALRQDSFDSCESRLC